MLCLFLTWMALLTLSKVSSKVLVVLRWKSTADCQLYSPWHYFEEVISTCVLYKNSRLCVRASLWPHEQKISFCKYLISMSSKKPLCFKIAVMRFSVLHIGLFSHVAKYSGAGACGRGEMQFTLWRRRYSSEESGGRGRHIALPHRCTVDPFSRVRQMIKMPCRAGLLKCALLLLSLLIK